jgi:hypothetical protein
VSSECPDCLGEVLLAATRLELRSVRLRGGRPGSDSRQGQSSAILGRPDRLLGPQLPEVFPPGGKAPGA